MEKISLFIWSTACNNISTFRIYLIQNNNGGPGVYHPLLPMCLQQKLATFPHKIYLKM